MNEKLHIIRNASDLANLIGYLSDKDLIAVDTETTGVHIGCQVIGISVCAQEDEAYYVVTHEWDKDKQELVCNFDVVPLIDDFLRSLEGKKLVMHNAVFDCRVIYDNYKVQLIQDVFADIMVMAHLVDEEGPKALKELGTALLGGNATKEQEAMKASVIANGGVWQDGKGSNKEMFKANIRLLAEYGAKDAILTYILFLILCGKLIDENLTDFFFNEESMPLLRGPTYDLNTVGLKVDLSAIKQYEKEMTHEIERLKGQLTEDLASYTAEREEFSITSNQDLAWLLFIKMGFVYRGLTPAGKTLAKDLLGRVPYSNADKRKFINTIISERKSLEAQLEAIEAKSTHGIKELKSQRAKLNRDHKKDPHPDYDNKLGQIEHYIEILEKPLKTLRSRITKLYPEKYIQADKDTLKDISGNAKWISTLLKLKSEEKLLGTYIQGIQERVHYGIVYPRFNQTGTPSGRYSSSDPNFQNLPRDDKRVKSCIIARPGKVFIGADFSQLEPRVFSSISGDERLLECFEKGEDFYSVVGIAIFGRYDCSAYKNDPNAFATKYPVERQIAKQVCLASAYGTTAHKQAQVLRDEAGKSLDVERCQEIIDDYFTRFPKVKAMMIGAHDEAKRDGVVFSLYGRPRRLPLAQKIGRMYPKMKHADLKYEDRTVLNLSMNFKCQSAAASIVNRAAIRFKAETMARTSQDPLWAQVVVVLQVHDELVAEAPEALQEATAALLKDCMENTTLLPGVRLLAEPKIARNLADLK